MFLEVAKEQREIVDIEAKREECFKESTVYKWHTRSVQKVSRHLI